MPERIQQRRKKGWRMPPNTVSVARPHRWGNPFRVGTAVEVIARDGRRMLAATPNNEGAVTNFRTWLAGGWDIPGVVRPTLDEIRSELSGKNLACFCPHQPCHADVLLELANPSTNPKETR